MPSIEPNDAVKIVEAAKGTWQWVAGGIASGAYAVWKYFNHRIEKLEGCIVTSTQLREHTEQEEKKFDALFRLHRETAAVILDISKAVSRLEGKAERDK